MAQRRFHYEQAFEYYLRAHRITCVAVDEAKKALLPAGRHAARRAGAGPGPLDALKSFDFVVYTDTGNLLVDVKGRLYGAPGRPAATGGRRFENWVTREDVEALHQWQSLFGAGFRAVFVFLYCLRQQPPDALFEEIFAFAGRWYVPRVVTLDDYARRMKPRSMRWGTVHVPADDFARISRPFTVRGGAGGGIGPACGPPKPGLS